MDLMSGPWLFVGITPPLEGSCSVQLSVRRVCAVNNERNKGSTSGQAPVKPISK